MKALPSGVHVTSFSLAINSNYKDKNGEKKEKTEFVNIIVFGKQAESSNQYLKKGQQCLVEGRLQTRSWDNPKTGTKSYRTEIVADRVQFGPRSGKTGSGTDAEPKDVIDADTNKKTKAKVKPETMELGGIEYPTNDINPDDIPF